MIQRFLGSSAPHPPVPVAPVVPVGGAEFKQFGLENVDNTCYINAIFQALYSCSPFRELVIASPDSSNPFSSSPPPPPPPTSPPVSPISASTSPKPAWSSRAALKRRDSLAADRVDPNQPNHSALSALPIPIDPPTLFSALRSLFLHIARHPSDKGKVSPTAFVKKVRDENEAFRNNDHQDAHELLIFLLNKIVEDLELQAQKTSESQLPSDTGRHSERSLKTTTPAPKTLVHHLFEGILTSETRCLTCETVSSRDESFLDLSIDIEANSSVTSCLRQFSASEMLCQRNKFSCDSCSGLQEAERRMKVKKLPNILALHLKRFKYQEDVRRFIKLSYRVAFPLELRLFNTVDDAQNPDRLYELFAIVVHIGGGPHHGHYTSIVRSRGSWHLYDDDGVESVKECDIPKYFGESNVGAGYVLFYQAVDLDYDSIGLSIDPSNSETGSKNPQEAPLIWLTPNNGDRSVQAKSEDISPKVSPQKITPEEHVNRPSTGSSSKVELGPDVHASPTIRHSKSERSLPKRRSTTSGAFPPVPPMPSLPAELESYESAMGISVSSRERGADNMEQRRGWFSRGKPSRKRTKELVSPSNSAEPFGVKPSIIDGIASPKHIVPEQQASSVSNGDTLASGERSSDPHGPTLEDNATEHSQDIGFVDSDHTDANEEQNHLTVSEQSLSSGPTTFHAPPVSQHPFNPERGKHETNAANSGPSASPQSPASNYYNTNLPKKASRKLSLSSMPQGLRGLIGRNYRDKE